MLSSSWLICIWKTHRCACRHEYVQELTEAVSGERNTDGTLQTLPHSFSFEKVPLPCSRLGSLFIFLAIQLQAQSFWTALSFIKQIHTKGTKQHQLLHLNSVPSLEECSTCDFWSHFLYLPGFTSGKRLYAFKMQLAPSRKIPNRHKWVKWKG